MYYLQRPALAALAVCLCLSGCAEDEAQQARQQPSEALEAATDDPVELAGQSITLRAEVDRVFGDCAYLISSIEETLGVFDDDSALTLCQPSPPADPIQPPALAEGDVVEISGTVSEMTRDSYESQTTLTLPDNVFDERETRVVIMIDAIRKLGDPEA